MKIEPEDYEKFSDRVYSLAGLHKCGYDKSKLSEGMRVVLLREPNNPFDKNAIRVEERATRTLIAYLPREVAAVMAPKLDLKTFPFKAELRKLTKEENGATFSVWGVRVQFYRPKANASVQ